MVEKAPIFLEVVENVGQAFDFLYVWVWLVWKDVIKSVRVG